MFPITTRQHASELEVFAKIGQVQRDAAQKTAAIWIAENDLGIRPFEDGVLEIIDRILAI